MMTMTIRKIEIPDSHLKSCIDDIHGYGRSAESIVKVLPQFNGRIHLPVSQKVI